uniref:Uncharacterized protein n=1 Tax=Arundo donax TaxID=35708 RepID=A0A0A9CQJ7_ARUDO
MSGQTGPNTTSALFTFSLRQEPVVSLISSLSLHDAKTLNSLVLHDADAVISSLSLHDTKAAEIGLFREVDEGPILTGFSVMCRTHFLRSQS